MILKYFQSSAKEVCNHLLYNRLTQLAILLWFSFALLITLFYIFIAPEDTDVSVHWASIISAASVFTIPLFWISPKWRWTMWAVMGILTIYCLITIDYMRNFFSLMPLSSIFQIKNIDGMVFESAIVTFKWIDLWLLFPIAFFILIWRIYLHRTTKGQRYSHQYALRATATSVLIWLICQIICVFTYAQTSKYLRHNESNTSITELAFDKFRGRISTRYEYLYHNGLDVYLLWSLGDLFPHITLNKAEKKLVTNFEIKQKEYIRNSKLLVERIPEHSSDSVHNLLIIMVESFENWPLELRLPNGKPCLEYFDSLINMPGTLYFPHLVSQASVGHSSDGHLIDLTGLLPLREDAAVTNFYDNDYPTIFKAFKQKYGGTTFEIISDDPIMWNQNETYRHYGFDYLYDRDDIDPKHLSNWTTRDSYLGKYTASFLNEISEPFAGMSVTLSLHTPYRSTISGHPEIDELDIDPQSIHYLKICKNDEIYISWIIDALKKRGIYDNTVIVITGDHSAHSLFKEHRPKATKDDEPFIPLIILNSGYKSAIYPGIAGQIDIYPTLLDIMGMENYTWPGVGRSLIRHIPGGATTRSRNIIGTLSAEEESRQKAAWDVSDLLIRSNSLNNR